MKTKISLITKTLLFSACFALPLTSFAQASGSLDLSFDTDGKIITDIGAYDEATSVVIQSDGKIVMAGSSNIGTQDVITLIRYNTNGSLDNTFDTDGKVTTAIGNISDIAHAMAVQSDGKIVLAGSSLNSLTSDIALVRYNTNGSLDSTFDTDGIVITPIGALLADASGLAILIGGKIVVAGHSYNGSSYEFVVIRYNANGSLDNSFDTDGIVTTDIGPYSDVAFSIAIQSDGKVLVAGYSNNGSNDDFALVRYNVNGSLDSSFDTDGIVTTAIDISSNDISFSLATQSDGKIVVAGSRQNASGYDIALVRYNTNGSLDSTFDSDGKVTTPIGTNNDEAFSLAVLIDGKIIAAGYSNNSSNNDIALVRYNANGSLDNTFDTDGIVTTDIGTNNDIATTLALQNDGKIVVAGYSDDGSNNDFAVVRYINDASVGINEIHNKTSEISISPNPFSSSTIIETDYLLKNANLNVYDIYGQRVKQITNLSGHTFTLHRDNLPSGMYFIQLTQDNIILSTNKLLISDSR